MPDPDVPAKQFENLLPPQPTGFTQMLIGANGLDPVDFDGWIFDPGMLFGSLDKWWGDRGQRDFPHEGIDIGLYQNRARQVLLLGPQTRIPVMYTGVVRALFQDYLGQAVIVEHPSMGGAPKTFLSVYAHTRPLAGLQVGTTLKRGDILATIADTRKSKAKILPHLHFSLGIPAAHLDYEQFVWNIMRDPEQVVLLNPLARIDWSYRLQPAPRNL